jgi:uracil-DNA glycosylase
MPKLALRVGPWQAHVRAWGGCTRCHLSEVRTEVVLARGDLPCHVLFVGEAPGKSEDCLGKPFVGPAGKLLDDIVEDALADRSLRVAFTNLIACIPKDEDGDKLEPPDESVAACSPRLVELVRMARPCLLVRVGAHAQHYLSPGYRHSIRTGWSCKVLDMLHPAAILRKPAAFQTIEVQRAVVTLRNATTVLESGRPADADPMTPTAWPGTYDDIPF